MKTLDTFKVRADGAYGIATGIVTRVLARNASSAVCAVATKAS
jgi:hypothetical protein